MWCRVRNDRVFLVLLVALLGVAWLSLWVWGQSPYGRYLNHNALTKVTSEDVAVLVLFVAGWSIMAFAMMLPTSLPLVTLFNTMVRDRSDHLILMTLLLTGYLGVWVSFGILIHVGDLAIHEVTRKTIWLTRNYWVIGASTLMIAGIYQFTPLKYHCLNKCRSPFSFVAGHWTGKNHWRQAFRLGIDHGIFCMGCCWSLMLLMFAVGAGNIGWMLLLGAIMSIEKNMPWGRRISRPLGAALVAWAAAIAIGIGFYPL